MPKKYLTRLAFLQLILLASFALPLDRGHAKALFAKLDVDDLVATMQDRVFPLEASKPVIERLNYLFESEGRIDDIKERLARMKEFEDLILDQLKQHNLPKELLAIPFVESGFKNYSPQKSGTGLWMFTSLTARAYGLVVDGERDDRMDPEKATKAAVKLLKDYYAQFDDWLLALAAYNQGPTRLQRIIRQTGQRDAWQLIKEGHINDFAARVVTAAIILEKSEQLIAAQPS